MFDNFMPEKVIICHDKEVKDEISSESGDQEKSDVIDIPK